MFTDLDGVGSSPRTGRRDGHQRRREGRGSSRLPFVHAGSLEPATLRLLLLS